MAEKVKTCVYHCGHCQRCFHSLGAFDSHRVGDHASDDPELGRRCLHPIEILDADGKMRLVEYTTDGECRVYQSAETGEGIRYGATIWTTAGYEQVGERWKGPTGAQQAAGDHATPEAVGGGQSV